MKIGYARVSKLDQNTELQVAALKDAGCDEIYSENLSGKNRNRPELKALLKSLRKDDTVVATKIDRLARSLTDLFKISEEIEEKEAHLKILEHDFDTSKPTGKLLFSVLGALAEFERSREDRRTEEARNKDNDDARALEAAFSPPPRSAAGSAVVGAFGFAPDAASDAEPSPKSSSGASKSSRRPPRPTPRPRTRQAAPGSRRAWRSASRSSR